MKIIRDCRPTHPDSSSIPTLFMRKVGSLVLYRNLGQGLRLYKSLFMTQTGSEVFHKAEVLVAEHLKLKWLKFRVYNRLLTYHFYGEPTQKPDPNSY